ncbi:phosphate:Na+ symporter [Thermodesulfitimonas autotrophica]|uniref:Phosphate:Na+ symporter n=1 Tax=Thermodesulfitimonas autotrophica TaxID=1894989 RepID=A0A3N5BQ31_9THEO|nr:Na/Pi cotransporter family protein [Thermodesulfitimonas autotrophica]RPF49722.1 phosphate:Na+ symporter [Thermodesulfitimonas autotrophica]
MPQELSLTTMALMLLGGMGLLLYGISVMSEGLQKIAGHRLRQIFSAVTDRPFLGLVAGAVVTILFQSSTATTVILVGLAAASVVTLRQCLPVILGADIGTTVTAQLIALKVTEISLPIVGVGALIVFFSKKDRYRRVGQAVIGFGLLFLGLKIMGDAMAPLRYSAVLKEALLGVSSSPLLAILIAAIFTFLVHSSAAALGVIVVLASQGLIDTLAAFYFILGANVGSSFTAVFSSLGSHREAQRVAAAHVLAKVGGTFLVFPFAVPFVNWLTSVTSSPSFQVANAHTLFNVFVTCAFFPLRNFGARALERLLPEKKIPDFEPRYLNEALLDTPSIALGLAYREVARLSAEVLRMFRDVDRVLRFNKYDLTERMIYKENVVNTLFSKATAYITLLLRRPLSRREFEKGMGLIKVLNDLELISDIISKNIVPQLQQKIRERIIFSSTGWEELSMIYQEVCLMMRLTHKALVRADYCLAEQAIKLHPRVLKLERGLRSTHIYRLREGIKETEASSRLHLELLNAYVRIAEHLRNIALTVAGELTAERVCPPEPPLLEEEPEEENAVRIEAL